MQEVNKAQLMKVIIDEFLVKLQRYLNLGVRENVIFNVQILQSKKH